MLKLQTLAKGTSTCRLIFIILFLLPGIIGIRANEEKTIKIFYKISSAVIDSSFKSNQKELSRFINMLERKSVDTIFITPSASPDGKRRYNENLRHQRAQAIINYVEAHRTDSSEVCFVIRNAPLGWNVLADVLQNDSDSNISSNVYCLLRDDKLADTEKQRKLHNSRAMYTKFAKRWLPELRYAKCMVHYKESEVQPNVSIQDTIESSSIQVFSDSLSDVVIPQPNTVAYCRELSPWHLSTNVAYWLALAQNIGVVYDLDDCRALSIEGACAWWSNLHKQRVYRWMAAEVVYRRYFKHEIPHQGWFAGAYLQTGLFEMMFNAKNRKGEFWGGGLAGGYSWKLNNRFSLSTELGLGCMFIKYRYARDIDGTLIRQGRSTCNYYGPTRLAVSLTYNFFKNRKVK